MRVIDPRQYRFTEWTPNDVDGPFAFMKQHSLLGRGVEEVRFDEDQLDELEYEKNFVSFSYYGSGRVDEHAAMLLDDGRVLFCIVSGSQFAGTFSSAYDIRMQYYLCTPLDKK